MWIQAPDADADQAHSRVVERRTRDVELEPDEVAQFRQLWDRQSAA